METEASCFLFVVDAYPSGVAQRQSWEPDPRHFYDHIVDTNIFDAFDALLANRRRDLLSYVGFDTSATWLPDYVHAPGAPEVTFAERRRVVTFDVPFSYTNVGQLSRVVEGYSESNAAIVGTPKPPVPPGHFRCTAWHIDLSGLTAIRAYRGRTGADPVAFSNNRAPENRSIVEALAKLQLVLDQTETNFKLKGPEGCSEQVLQEALSTAAHVLVREDQDARSEACWWFKNHGFEPDRSCWRFPGNSELELSFDLRARSSDVDGTPRDSSVSCVLRPERATPSRSR